MNNTLTNNIIFLCSLILLGIVSRIMPHPDNFTAIGAVALFAGAYSRKRNLHFLIPMVAIFISNILLIVLQNKPLPSLPIQIAIYSCFLLYTPIGSFLISPRPAPSFLSSNTSYIPITSLSDSTINP